MELNFIKEGQRGFKSIRNYLIGGEANIDRSEIFEYSDYISTHSPNQWYYERKYNS